MIEKAVLAPFLGKKLSILIYHRVLAEGEPGFGDPTEAQFLQQMESLRKAHRVLPLAEAVDRLKNGTLPAGASCVTFDDGYRDNYTRALPILQGLSIPATFFIATDYLDGGAMWNDQITYGLLSSPETRLDLSDYSLGIETLGTSSQRIDLAKKLLSKLKHLSMPERAQKARDILELSKGSVPSDLMMTSDELKKMAQAGMEIGGHTMSHPILSRLTDEEVENEIRGGKTFLENLLGKEITSFAYPNGKPTQDYLSRHAEIVARAGFKRAVSTAWGVSRPDSDPFQLPRFTPWDKTPGKFRLRLYRNALSRSYDMA